MLIIDDKQEQETVTRISSRAGPAERSFYFLYETFISMASEHGRLLVLVSIIEQLQIAAIAFFSYVFLYNNPTSRE